MELSVQDKITIVEQHLQNLEFSLYNLNLTVIEINATSFPNQADLDNLAGQIKDNNAKKAALQKELNALNSQLPSSINQG